MSLLWIKRKWFRDHDGTFYRNANLVHNEMETITRLGVLQLLFLLRLRQLRKEWDYAWSVGPIRKQTLGYGDIEVQPLPMRIAYPQHPALWWLDER